MRPCSVDPVVSLICDRIADVGLAMGQAHKPVRNTRMIRLIRMLVKLARTAIVVGVGAIAASHVLGVPIVDVLGYCLVAGYLWLLVWKPVRWVFRQGRGLWYRSAGLSRAVDRGGASGPRRHPNAGRVVR